MGKTKKRVKLKQSKKPQKSKRTKKPKYSNSFKSTKSLKKGEYLVFRTPQGKLTKFDGRKNLLAEIWVSGKKTDRYYGNTISKKDGQPLPKKFDSRKITNLKRVTKFSKSEIKESTEIKDLKIKIDARFSIQDNILAKSDIMLSDCMTFSKRKNALSLTTEMQFKKDERNMYEVFRSIHQSNKKDDVALDIARMIISRLYREKLRMSNFQISPLGRRGKYVRSITVFFSWHEAKL